MPDDDDTEGPVVVGDFEAFFRDAEPRLRRALAAAHGAERGREAAAEALTWAWEHWAQVQAMTNPVGYLYRVGQSRSRPRRRRALFAVPEVPEHLVEPALAAALDDLSERQRVAVVLVHGFGWTAREVGALLGIGSPTVQTHVDRALARLRASLEVQVHGS